MSEKTIVIFKAVIAIVLLVAIGAGLFLGGRWVFQKIDAYNFDKATHNDDGTTKLPTGSDTGSDTGADSGGDTTTKPEETTPAFYINEDTQTGYSRLANVTFFFKVITPVDRYVDYYGSVKTCQYFTIYDNTFGAYGSYDVQPRYSKDGQLWSKFNNSEFAQIQVIDKLYVSYTTVTDCADPMATLEELNINVFDKPEVFYYTMEYAAG